MEAAKGLNDGIFGGNSNVLERITEFKKQDGTLCGAILSSATKNSKKKGAKGKPKDPSKAGGTAAKQLAAGGRSKAGKAAKAKKVKAKKAKTAAAAKLRPRLFMRLSSQVRAVVMYM